MSGSLLEVRDLRVVYTVSGRELAAVDGVSFDLDSRDRVGIIGESGSGKSSLARALLGLLPGARATGNVRLDGEDLLSLPEESLRAVRWSQIAVCLQGTGNAFSPVHRMGRQIADPLRSHLGISERAAGNRVRAAAELAHLPHALLDRYPHELSGGEKQRAMLAMALAGEPRVLVADEPTSGLDPSTAAEVLDDLTAIQERLGFALLICSHNLVDVGRVTNRALVLYAGRIVETAPSSALIDDPRHPYSCGLVASHPAINTGRDLRGIGGLSPDPVDPPPGCRFHPRCTQVVGICTEQVPPLVARDGHLVACHLGGRTTVLAGASLVYRYPGEGRVVAVDGVTVTVRHGEVVAVVGETGSGKTTLAKLMVGLLRPATGSVSFKGQLIQQVEPTRLRGRGGMHMVFQDPYAAVSARLTVLEAVREPLDIHRIGDNRQRDELVCECLRKVRLQVTDAFLGARSHQLSGGQLQRVGIARALVLEPSVLIADEPVSMLDGSEQANLLNLLKDLQTTRGLAMVLVSHDIAAACRLADRVIVMRFGRIVEEGSAETIMQRAHHTYTRRLIAAARLAEPSPLEV